MKATYLLIGFYACYKKQEKIVMCRLKTDYFFISSEVLKT